MKIQLSNNSLKLLMVFLLPVLGMKAMDINFEQDFSGNLFPGDRYVSYAWNACSSFFKIKQVQNTVKAVSYTLENPAGAICDASSIAWHSGKGAITNFANGQVVKAQTFAHEQIDKAQAFAQVKVEETKALIQARVDQQIAAQITPIKTKAIKYVKVGVGVAVGSIVLYYTAKLAAKKIEEHRRIPRLAYASSELTIPDQCKSLLGKYCATSKSDVILSLENNVKFAEILELTKKISAQVIVEKSIKYRNLLLSGPSGTGKSIFAQNLAIDLAMDYYMFNAAVFLDEQKDQKTHVLQALITWAEGKSAKGRLVFIDNADLLFAKSHKAIVKDFLEYIRSRSSRTMFVFTTNKQVANPMLNACVDDMVIFKLPNAEERLAILNQYINAYLLHDGIAQALRDSVFSVLHHEKIVAIAQLTEGFSGEALKNYVNTIRTCTSSKASIITQEIVDEVLQQAIAKNNQLNKTEAQ